MLVDSSKCEDTGNAILAAHSKHAANVGGLEDDRLVAITQVVKI